MDETWYDIPWKIFCIGELGAEFYNKYKDKLGEQFTFCLLDNPDRIKDYCDSETYSKEHQILIAEYEHEIWNSYLDDKEAKKLLHKITLKFIIIHPVNNVLSPMELQFFRLMWDEPPANFDPEFPHTLLLAMPDSILQSSLESKCSAIYDLIAFMYLRCIGADYHNLVGPGEQYNQYGLVYKANCPSLMQMVQIAAEITEQIIQDIPIEDITSVRGMIFSAGSLKLTSNIVAVWKDAFEGKTDFEWSQHLVGASEPGVTVVVYRKLNDLFP